VYRCCPEVRGAPTVRADMLGIKEYYGVGGGALDAVDRAMCDMLPSTLCHTLRSV
jgi:hypothetical protein